MQRWPLVQLQSSFWLTDISPRIFASAKLAEYLLVQEQRLNYSALNDALVSGFVKGIQSYKSGFREAETSIITNAENTFGGGFTFNFISFNYMVKKGSLHIIIHKYDAPEDGLIRRAFRLFTNAVRKDFVAYSGLDETQKEAIMARIHVDKTNVFADLCKLVESPANTPIAEEATASA